MKSCTALAAARLKSASPPAAGAGTISGQPLVRMVWSGVMTPARAMRATSRPLTNARMASLLRNSQDQPPPGAFDVAILQGAGAAQDRRHLGDRGRALGQRRAREHPLAPALQPRLGQRHHLDHALVGLARARAEREDAVLVEDQALDARVGVEHVGCCLGEAEPRPVVGHEPQACAVDLARQLGAIRLVDQAEHGVGVRVVDVGVRHEGVQQHLHRRARRRRIEQPGALHAHHVVVAQRLAPAQLAQRLELDGRQARRIDRGHVPARALDAQHLVRLAGQVRHLGLERGVAAAVQHERGIAARAAASCRRAAPAPRSRLRRRRPRPPRGRRHHSTGSACGLRAPACRAPT